MAATTPAPKAKSETQVAIDGLRKKIQSEKDLAQAADNLAAKLESADPPDPTGAKYQRNWAKIYRDRAAADNEQLKTLLADEATARALVTAEKAKTKTKTSTTASTADTETVVSLKEYTGSFVYNLPMVSSAYFRSDPNNPQALGTSEKINDFGANLKGNARNAWKSIGSNNARGAIQMDRYLVNNAQGVKGKKPKNFDDTKYGFRFLYNPSSVSMSWGLSTEVNWDYVSGGFDKAVPLAEGLLKGTVSFSILLNRIEDMKYLDKFGLKKDQTESPYPVSVNNRTSDLQEIYKKGTMYDVDYLFRVIMGKNARYSSSINGLTADKGWLNGAPVELHLGHGLRYRVRISAMSVGHAIFNERMTPILSTLNLTCTRFYDGVDVAAEVPVTNK